VCDQDSDGCGVRDDDIVEVGRPQLAGLSQASEGTSGPLRTVLYAPTWEGWDADDLTQTSLVLMGPHIVCTLPADAPQLRVLYKLHPLTGTRDPRAAKAHEKISDGWSRHHVITGPRPTVYECFNQSDMLISDISSVVSDFIATGRPYMVTNPGGLADEEFRAKYSSAVAAYLIGPDCAGLDDIFALAAGNGGDPLARDRRKLRRYLLGPDSPDAQTRFNRAVARLAERAGKPVASHAVDGRSGSPAQRKRWRPRTRSSTGRARGNP
jgi:hypothetical protein